MIYSLLLTTVLTSTDLEPSFVPVYFSPLIAFSWQPSQHSWNNGIQNKQMYDKTDK